MTNKIGVVVLGGYVNGYSIIRELSEKNVENIILIDSRKSIGSYSNKIHRFFCVEDDHDKLLEFLQGLRQEFAQLILFPTADIHLENIFKIHQDLESFCFIPFNPDNLLDCLDKRYQYSFCEKLGIPYPKTLILEIPDDSDRLFNMDLPIIVKPYKQDNSNRELFKNLRLFTREEIETNTPSIRKFLENGVSFLASEIIPGDVSNIYAHIGYRTTDGRILNEWTGKKLSQFPDDYGVFASASNQAPEIVCDQGRRLLKELDLMGITESEFKYDIRDGKYKLMEINLRSTMWHRIGNLSGVNIQYTQYLDAIGEEPERQSQVKDRDIHFVYFKHELHNVLLRRGYLRVFINCIFRSDKTHFALFNWRDMKPAVADFVDTIQQIVRGR